MTTTTADLELVEREDLTHRLQQAGVDFSPDTTLEGLRGLANLLANDASDEVAKPEPPASESASEVASTAGFGETAAGTATGPNGGALFNVDDYADPTLALPPVDGHTIERIAINFTGSIMLDRNDRAHVALWRRLKLGAEVELWVSGTGVGLTEKKATSKDGELDVVVAERKVKIDTVRILGAEDLAEAKLEVASQARDAAENQDARDRLPSDA